MGTSGTATIDFGAIGSKGNSTSVGIIGQAGINSASQIDAWLRIEATAEHTVDELLIDPIRVTAGTIVAGTGFTIYGDMPYGTAYGTYKIDWAWV